ncbi:hydroxyacid dehydrogenase [Candidatus Woesearchaeota archaeon]|nr:hydroxyacid dehydrogenase [Candidatus Woesearchaeota archaeon]
MKIAFFETKKIDRVIFRKNLKKHTLLFSEEPLTPKNAYKYKTVDAVAIFISSQVTKPVLNQLPKLKLITTQSTGYDHINLKEAKKRKITVCNVPFYGENTVAEHTFALILNLSRHVHKSYIRTLREDYSREGLTGFDLKGKTLGVIGAGHIGLHVIRIAKGFGMHVLAFDNHPNTFLAEVLHFNYVSMEEILAKADIITLHVPLLPQTTHLIGDKAIKKMKQGVILINTSRGPVIDVNALYRGLRSGKIGGAGLDVIEAENILLKKDMDVQSLESTQTMRQLLEDKQILEMENVIFTPHNAFNSKEAIDRIKQTTIENILGFIQRKEIHTI